jgi:hypothetical protein
MFLMTRPPAIPSTLPDSPPLVLDLGGEPLSAAGIGELVRLNLRLRRSGGRLVLINVAEAARGALTASGLAGALGCGVVRPAPEGAEEKGETAGCACGKV